MMVLVGGIEQPMQLQTLGLLLLVLILPAIVEPSLLRVAPVGMSPRTGQTLALIPTPTAQTITLIPTPTAQTLAPMPTAQTITLIPTPAGQTLAPITKGEMGLCWMILADSDSCRYPGDRIST